MFPFKCWFLTKSWFTSLDLYRSFSETFSVFTAITLPSASSSLGLATTWNPQNLEIMGSSLFQLIQDFDKIIFFFGLKITDPILKDGFFDGFNFNITKSAVLKGTKIFIIFSQHPRKPLGSEVSNPLLRIQPPSCSSPCEYLEDVQASHRVTESPGTSPRFFLGTSMTSWPLA